MRHLFPIALILVASIATAQEPLNVEVSIVEVDAVVQTVKKTVVSFESADLESSESVESSETAKRKAALVSVSEEATVDAFSKDFEVAQVIETTGNRFLVLGSPGKYMLVIDTGDRNKFMPVVIPGSEDNPPPPKDDDPPASDLSSLKESSSMLADKLGDPVARKLLADALDIDLPDDFEQAKNKVQDAVNNTLLFRKRVMTREEWQVSRLKDWMAGWRRPLVREMDRLEVDTLEEYKKAVRLISIGLGESSEPDQIRSIKSTTPKQDLPSDPIPITHYLRSTTELVPVIVKECGPFGRCIDRVRWIEVTR